MTTRIGLSGEPMAREDYRADFVRLFWRSGAGDFWKIERTQVFIESNNPSYDAFAVGDWTRALRLLDERGQAVADHNAKVTERGIRSRRVRVVEAPFAPYLVWELNSLRRRAELGDDIRVVRAERVAAFEPDGPVPDLVGFDLEAAYHIRYTPEELYDEGEPVIEFFEREIRDLHPVITAG